MKGNVKETSVNEDHTPVLALGEFTGSLDTDEWLSRSTVGVLKDIQLVFSIQRLIESFHYLFKLDVWVEDEC